MKVVEVTVLITVQFSGDSVARFDCLPIFSMLIAREKIGESNPKKKQRSTTSPLKRQ